MSGLAIIIPSEIATAIRQHVAETPRGNEACGRLVISTADGHAVEYVRVRNGTTEPGKARFSASWRRRRGYLDLLVHSHPNGNPQPSEGDLLWASDRTSRGREHRSVFGIWAGGFLSIYRMTDLQTRSYERVPVSFEIEG